MNQIGLRLNNYINVNGELQEVTELPLPENCTDKNTKFIKLTKQWYLDFGFKPDIDLSCLLVRNGLWVNENNLEMSYYSAKIKKRLYVHQVQNLFFDLTDEELSIVSNSLPKLHTRG